MKNDAAVRGRSFALCIQVAALLFAGCSKLTPENYAKLKAGMTYDEVVEVIGAPSECAAVLNAKSCLWKEGGKKIDVKFIGEKVVIVSSRER